jgi:hypothetical protein
LGETNNSAILGNSGEDCDARRGRTANRVKFACSPSKRYSGCYPRQREYPQPPPPSKNNTIRTITMVDIFYISFFHMQCRLLAKADIRPRWLDHSNFGNFQTEARTSCSPLVKREVPLTSRSTAGLCLHMREEGAMLYYPGGRSGRKHPPAAPPGVTLGKINAAPMGG